MSFTLKETKAAFVTVAKAGSKIGPKLIARAVLVLNTGGTRGDLREYALEYDVNPLYLNIANKVSDTLKGAIPEGDHTLAQVCDVLEARVIELKLASRDDGKGTLMTWHKQLKTGQVQTLNAVKSEDGTVTDAPKDGEAATDGEAAPNTKGKVVSLNLKTVLAYLENASFEETIKIATACNKRMVTFKTPAEQAA